WESRRPVRMGQTTGGEERWQRLLGDDGGGLVERAKRLCFPRHDNQHSAPATGPLVSLCCICMGWLARSRPASHSLSPSVQWAASQRLSLSAVLSPSQSSASLLPVAGETLTAGAKQTAPSLPTLGPFGLLPSLDKWLPTTHHPPPPQIFCRRQF